MFSRAHSLLVEDRKAVNAEVKKVRALLQEVADMELPREHLLTPGELQSAIRKMKLLTSLVSELPIFHSQISQAVR